MSDELKPCPFNCGEEVEFKPKTYFGEEIRDYLPDQIVHNCKVLNQQICLRGGGKEQLFNKWNTRSSGWVSVDDRLPEIGEKVLIRIPVCNHHNIENATYRGSGVFSAAWCSRRGNGCAYKVSEWLSMEHIPTPPETKGDSDE